MPCVSLRASVSFSPFSQKLLRKASPPLLLFSNSTVLLLAHAHPHGYMALKNAYQFPAAPMFQDLWDIKAHYGKLYATIFTKFVITHCGPLGQAKQNRYMYTTVNHSYIASYQLVVTSWPFISSLGLHFLCLAILLFLSLVSEAC